MTHILKINSRWYLHIFLIIIFCWGIDFIYRTSAVGLDGNQYWILFDDGMISMRYALNLVNGFGLTWNPGEYVEGFTNPLWTMIMALSISIFGKFYAPLIIQLLGLLLVMSAVFLTKKCNDKIFGQNSYWSYIATLLVLTYYPLMYWSLGGMEVSALTICMALALYIAICIPTLPYSLILIYGLICIAYLIRPDGFIALLPALAIHYKSSDRSLSALRASHIRGALSLALVVATLTLWRYFYYGELLPNTYTLKITGYDFIHRLNNGYNFIIPFFGSTAILWALSLYAIYSQRKNTSWYLPLCLASMPTISVLYQVYVGGDPWPYWRQLAPSILPLAMVAVIGLKCAIEKLKLPKKTALIISWSIPIAICVNLNNKFSSEIFAGKPYQFGAIEKLVQMSNLLNDVMPESRILVYWAGTLPYYYNGYAIDALGKSDKYIASLPPDYNIAWAGMSGVPGHAKYSLQYSMDNYYPDFLQYLGWGRDNVGQYGDDYFVAIEYKGKMACIRKHAKNVRWDLVKLIGKCSNQKELF